MVRNNLLFPALFISGSLLLTSQVWAKEHNLTEDEVQLEKPVYLSPLTPHSTSYNVYYGSISLGHANYQLPKTETGYYEYLFESDLSLLMLSDTRSLKSNFTLEDGGLEPFRYQHDRKGTGKDYTEQTAFAKAQQFIHTIYKNEALKLDYEKAVFDPLMVQLQFRMDVISQKRPLSYRMVKDKEIDEYDFKIIGPEQITVDGGTFKTIKFEVVRSSTKRQTFFWMAPDLAYLPVRLSHFSKGSKQLDIQLSSYKFESELPSIPSLDIPSEHAIFEAHMKEKQLKKEEDEDILPESNSEDISGSEINDIKKRLMN